MPEGEETENLKNENCLNLQTEGTSLINFTREMKAM